MTDSSKSKMRSMLRQRRRSLPRYAQIAAGQAIANFAGKLPAWDSAQRIAIYHSTDGEIDTHAIVQQCHGADKQVYLPVMGPANSLVFAQWCAGAELNHNAQGIVEPGPGARRCPAADLDIIFMPMVAWDKLGGRLGMGGGYYDRALAGVSGPLRVGLAHQLQEVDRVPLDSWDIPLNTIITDMAIYPIQR